MILVIFPLLIFSGLLALAFYGRIAILMKNLKVVQRERLSQYKELFYLEDAKKPDFVRHEMEHYLKMLELQTAQVIKRIKLIQKGQIFLLFSVGFSILALAGSLFANFDAFILFLFVFGVLSLCAALLYALFELRLILNPIQAEREFVQSLIKDRLEKI